MLKNKDQKTLIKDLILHPLNRDIVAAVTDNRDLVRKEFTALNS